MSAPDWAEKPIQITLHPGQWAKVGAALQSVRRVLENAEETDLAESYAAIDRELQIQFQAEGLRIAAEAVSNGEAG